MSEIKETIDMDKIDIIFESMPDDTVFYNENNKAITWRELRGELAEKILKLTPKLHKAGIRRVEVGSINWFYERRKTSGRFLNLDSMFIARLLKR